jgi:aspartyl-tRNA(Asn)/glutamyl-tRNA(Gln) amidotransferase subunit C
MPLDKSAIETIAYLARIRIADDELESLAGELEQIIGWVEQLSEVDTDGIEPMTSIASMILPERADAVTDGACADKVLVNAPDPAGPFFTVPKVVE